jgi:hypothetical protein
VTEGRLDDVNAEDGLCRQEYDQVYGYCLVTDGGVCEIVYRNSSNGYYGGFLRVNQDSPQVAGLLLMTEDWEAKPESTSVR